jgi:hypothetical protein
VTRVGAVGRLASERGDAEPAGAVMSVPPVPVIPPVPGAPPVPEPPVAPNESPFEAHPAATPTIKTDANPTLALFEVK